MIVFILVYILYYIQIKATTVGLIKFKEVFTMKKSSFITMMLGMVSGVLFALGMCMALIPEWSAFQPGIIFGCIGLIFGLITLIVWRKMEHKEPIQVSIKTILTIIGGIFGALALGVGMCFSMVWGKMIIGIIIGFIGVIILLCLIPLTKGIRE